MRGKTKNIKATKAAEKFYKRVAQEGKYTLLSDYAGNDAPVMARCNECGAVRTVKARGFFRHDCNHGKRVTRLNENAAKNIAEIEAKYPVKVIGPYTGYRAPLQIRFTDCGHERSIKVDDVLYSNRAPVCEQCAEEARQVKLEARKAEAQARKDISIIGRANRIRKALEKYKENGYEVETVDEALSAVTFRCGRCGHKFTRRVYDLERLHGCKACSRTGNSLGAQIVHNYLTSKKVDFEREVRFDSCKRERVLPFDFIVYNRQGEPVAAIEYQGEQHYKASALWGGEQKLKRVQEADAIKREWCKEHGVHLITIKYSDDIEAKLAEWFPLR